MQSLSRRTFAVLGLAAGIAFTATAPNTMSGWKVALLMIWPARVTSVKPMMAASEVPLITCTR